LAQDSHRFKKSLAMSVPHVLIEPREMATLKTISFEKLLCSDHDELVSLLSACADDGFFWLDLSREETKHHWRQAEEIFIVMKEFFDQPLEKKLEFDSRKLGLEGLNG
jgi:isopenicillin N synthase-like dioxygenase